MGPLASLFIANVMLFVMNVPMVRVFASMLAIPGWLLVPGILAVSFIGVYALSSSTFDLLLMVGIGIVGYFLRKMGMPMAPMVLGVVLGNLMGQNLRRALSITNGEVHILWSSPVTVSLWILAAAVLVVPPLLRRRLRRQSAAPRDDALVQHAQ